MQTWCECECDGPDGFYDGPFDWGLLDDGFEDDEPLYISGEAEEDWDGDDDDPLDPEYGIKEMQP